ncbi:MAG: NnrS family protein [Burkholderiaceae bacterium]
MSPAQPSPRLQKLAVRPPHLASHPDIPTTAPQHESADPPWSPGNLQRAPHRLAFFLGVVLLVAASAWWLAVHIGRQTWGWSLPAVVSPTLTHASMMSLGVFPVFFAGFLFTAGPKWLGVTPPDARDLMWPLGLQSLGWLVWMVGGALSEEVALTGLAMAIAGMLHVYLRFLWLVRASLAPDRLHAHLACVAGGLGVVALIATWVALWQQRVDLALLSVRTGLWGCVVTTFLLVAHRMLPFFTAHALPGFAPWRPRWVLWLLMGIAAAEALASWAPMLAPQAWLGARAPGAWMLGWGLAELAAGSLVLWLSLTWGLMQSMQVRLLAMLHVGFTWFGLALALSGASQLLGLRHGLPLLGLGALHALTMGFLGSVLMAMVTRVSSGHSGRPLTADNLAWWAFWALQLATVGRIASALEQGSAWLTLLAATIWLGVILLWGRRLVRWYGTPRADGQPG